MSDAQIGQIILRARRVVEDDGHAQHVIRTVPRFGFRWVAEGDTGTDSAAMSPTGILAPDVDEPGISTEADTRPRPPRRAEAPKASSRVLFHAGLLPRVPHHRRVALAMLLLATIGGGTLVWLARPRLPMPVAAQTSVLVLPTTIDADAQTAWARLGLMDFIADRFRRAGVPVPSSDSTLALLRTPGQQRDRHDRQVAVWPLLHQGRRRADLLARHAAGA